MGLKFRKIAYQGWRNCFELSNGTVDLVVTGDVGPRVIRFGFKGDVNEFKEYPGMMGKKGGREWRIYGGHRLWHAPEVKPRTYYPDNFPVSVKFVKGVVLVEQPMEPTTGIQKGIDILMDPKRARVQVVHRLTNHGPWPVELAPWALSVMAQGGRVIIPFPPRGSHEKNLLPANTLTLWPYTDMQDPRWTWGTKYILLAQDPAAAAPQKVGVQIKDGWTGYANREHFFLKQFDVLDCHCYPDHGCTMETFTNSDMLEVETLGPLVTLEPGQSVEHEERWSLFRDVTEPLSDADIDRDILPLVRSVK